MERYTEYTQEELAAMSDEEIQVLIDIEEMHDGLVPVLKPTKITLEDVGLVPTVTAYSVGGLLFKNQADAEKVASFPMLGEGYDYSGAGYDFRWVKPATHGVEIRTYFTEEEIRGRGATLRDNRKRKEIFDREQEKYREYQNKVQACTDEVWQAVSEARRYIGKVNCAMETLEKYRELSGGDEEVAKNFFRNTFKNQHDMLEAVLGETQTEEEA